MQHLHPKSPSSRQSGSSTHARINSFSSDRKNASDSWRAMPAVRNSQMVVVGLWDIRMGLGLVPDFFLVCERQCVEEENL